VLTEPVAIIVLKQGNLNYARVNLTYCPTQTKANKNKSSQIDTGHDIFQNMHVETVQKLTELKVKIEKEESTYIADSTYRRTRLQANKQFSLPFNGKLLCHLQ
jgi:hypothetical protein